MAGDPRQLVERLGIERAVLCAPMAKIAGGRLARAVSDAGGLGFIGGGYGDAGWIAEQVASAGGARIGIGLITWNIDGAAVAAALSHRPAALWLSFGDPSPYVESVKSAGAALICQVGSVEEALTAARAGADVIVAQGTEAGGHGQANRGLFGLLPAVAAAVYPVPVVAAGGIVERAGYEAALALGAAGVAIGTGFYATDEALDVDPAKQRLVEAGGDDTVRSVVYDIARGPEWPAPYSGRSLRTSLTDRWIGWEDRLREHLDDVRRDHDRATATNDMSTRVVWAGEGIDGITAIRPAAEVVEQFPVV